MKRTIMIAVAGLVALGGCSNKQRIQTEKEVAKALISDEQEAQLGLQVKQELQKQNIKYLTDPTVTTYVEGMTKRIFPLAEKDRKDIQWHVHVVDDPKVVNAFATPGGHLYVYSGLLMEAENEAEVAGVLSHEAGHVVGRHSARQMVNAFGLNAVASLALGENPGLLQQLATQIVGTGTMLAYSRGAENEADVYGVKYAAAAGYDPKGIATFFQKLKAKEGKTPQYMTWLRTHPATADRIKNINAYIAKHKLKGGETDAAGHMLVVNHLKTLTGAPVTAQPDGHTDHTH